MEKVLMLATTAAMIEQFNKRNIELLNEMGYLVDVAGNFKEGNPISAKRVRDFEKWVRERGGACHDVPMVRNPMALRQNRKAYQMIVGLLQRESYAFIHVHTPIGGVLGRVAAHRAGVAVIYTAHGFHFYKGAPIRNWLLYYTAEWLCSWWTDVLITINREDYDRAKRRLHTKRVEYVPGVGIDSKAIAGLTVSREERRRVWNIPERAVVALSVGELNQNKNHALAIQAIGQIKGEEIHYVVCGQGEERRKLERLAKKLHLGDRVHLLGFCEDALEIFRCSDIFVFPSKREGLSVALLEAMASGLPTVCFSIRGNVDLIEEGRGGYLAPAGDREAFASGIERLALSAKLREQMGRYNQKKAKRFDCLEITERMREIYQGAARGAQRREDACLWNDCGK